MLRLRLNEIEEEFFLFCSFSFSVFTQILLKLNIKYSNKIKLGGDRVNWTVCMLLFHRGSASYRHIYLINLEEDCC